MGRPASITANGGLLHLAGAYVAAIASVAAFAISIAPVTAPSALSILFSAAISATSLSLAVASWKASDARVALLIGSVVLAFTQIALAGLAASA
jgi:hypothetical protein